MVAKKSATDDRIEIEELRMGRAHCYIVGSSPMIMNRFSKKATEQLLFPSKKMNRAAKDVNLKHDPVAEFRDSVYRVRSNNAPTLIHVPTGAFHQAMASAALDIPGVQKAKIERLTSICTSTVHLYGVPKLMMAMVRSSDMNHTPDVRTRAAFETWCCELEIGFVASLIGEREIATLLSAAGIICGIGDYRPQKGGSFGRFRLVDHDDAEFAEIVKAGGRAQQVEALAHPQAFDGDSDELLAWFEAEAARRDRIIPSSQTSAPVVAVKQKKNGADATA